jgi:hypothetical protein
LQVLFSVTGTESENGRAGLAIFGFGPGQQVGGPFVRGGTLATFDPFPFVFGQQFSFNAEMSATTFLGPGVLSGFADYDNTAVLTSFAPFLDANFTLAAPNPTFTSISGTQYSTAGVVPEPGSFLLFGGALTAIAILRKTRRTADGR